MAIPSELIKPIDEIKTPSNKILIICLILAIVFLGTFIVLSVKDTGKNCKSEIAAKDVEIQRLNKYIIDKTEEDNRRLKIREAFMDSLNFKINQLKSQQ